MKHFLYRHTPLINIQDKYFYASWAHEIIEALIDYYLQLEFIMFYL